MNFARLLLRLTVGGFFIGHGTQKLFGWFGGHGAEGTGQFFESLGLRPGKRQALAAGTAEAGGGALLAAGLATPLAASSLTAVMLTAIQKVHLKNGPWAGDGGYEYNVVLIAAALTLAEVGPGAWSLDHALGLERSGTRWALAALGAGAVGAAVAANLGSAPEPSPTAEHASAGVEAQKVAAGSATA
jgi:putative oxidoreductase